MSDFTVEGLEGLVGIMEPGAYNARFEGIKTASSEKEDGTHNYVVLEYTIKEDPYVGREQSEMFDVTKVVDEDTGETKFANATGVRLLGQALKELGIEILDGGKFSDEAAKGEDFMLEITVAKTKAGLDVNNIKHRHIVA